MKTTLTDDGDAQRKRSLPNEEEKDDLGPLATYSDVFTFGNTCKVRVCRILGVLCAIVSGLTYAAMAFFFARVFEDLGATTDFDEFMKNIREIVFSFLILGAVGFTAILLQVTLWELAASEATLDLKKKWFHALLRQDMAYYDINNALGQATIVSTNAMTFKKGTGRKLAEGIQFFFTTLGGIGYGFYASWRVSLVILAVVPFMTGSGFFLLKAATTETERVTKNYERTGVVVYSTVNQIRTVFSLNACEHMIKKFEETTQEAYKSAYKSTYKIGLGTGLMMASFILSYVVLTLYGGYQLYDQVRNTGCDPSNVLTRIDSTVMSCSTTAADVFGALFGVTIGAIGLAQISGAIQALNEARAACKPAIMVITRNSNKIVGGEDNKFLRDVEKNIDHSVVNRKVISLPQYVIDSSSVDGKMPSHISSDVEFKGISFSYPTSANTLVLNEFNLSCEAGKTIALVGPSWSGKYTAVSLMERFYDPTSGSILFGGYDIRDLNVRWLRDQIGLVAQEPTLFTCSIKENIAYGCSDVTDEQIQDVAKLANAHDFISRFPEGYNTNLGDMELQLSEGEKQRIAIARSLLKKPKIILLDEATSALDAESEASIQQVMDEQLLNSNEMTTIVIAHRLSTMQNADMIAVVKNGRVVESGTHDELISTSGSEYVKIVEAQSPSKFKATNIISTPSSLESNHDKYDTLHDTTDTSRPQLEFSNVHFSSPACPEVAKLNGLNLKVEKGETLAIVGPSGGGKSTVLQMIERFYDPTVGSVMLNGEELKELNVKWLRDQLALVSQEPFLFNTTIRENIKAGNPTGSSAEIEEAARKANAHDFIIKLPNGYDTDICESGVQISGGQKQRIAIARAIMRKPKILLLDEVTSALDSESESIVQKVIDNLMSDKSLTVILTAHRVSTIQNADRIAVVADGEVKETGTHDELMALKDSYYMRSNSLYDFDSSAKTEIGLETTYKSENDEKEDKTESQGKNITIESVKLSKMLAKDDTRYIFIGAIGAMLAGVVFPAWGFVCAYMVEVLYEQIRRCDIEQIALFGTCEEYRKYSADIMRDNSINVTYGWIGILASTIIGNALLYYGFGVATERMNKRVRDATFTALMEQEIAYFDLNSIGDIATSIEEDAAMIHSFSGQPIRVFIMSIASMVVGLILAFIYMWPFALMTLAILPFLSFGAMMEMNMYMGEDDGSEARDDIEIGPGAIIVETLLNIHTVASLAVENKRFQEYERALDKDNSTSIVTNVLKGSAIGLGFSIQIWGMAFMFWWGAFCLNKWPNIFDFHSLLISMFSLLFSISGLTMAFAGAADKVRAKTAANRIFALLSRKSAINALSTKGLHANKETIYDLGRSNVRTLIT